MEMCEIAFLLAISKGCGEGGTVSSFHAFRQTVISTAAAVSFLVRSLVHKLFAVFSCNRVSRYWS